MSSRVSQLFLLLLLAAPTIRPQMFAPPPPQLGPSQHGLYLHYILTEAASRHLKRRNFLSFCSLSLSLSQLQFRAQERSLEMYDITIALSQSSDGSDVTEQHSPLLAPPPPPPHLPPPPPFLSSPSAAAHTLRMDDVIVLVASRSDRRTDRCAQSDNDWAFLGEESD